MADEPALLPLRMVNEYAYCPRLFWLEYVDRSFADSHDTVDGQRTHRNVDRSGEPAASEFACPTRPRYCKTGRACAPAGRSTRGGRAAVRSHAGRLRREERRGPHDQARRRRGRRGGLIDVSHLSVFGNVQVSTQALRALLERKVPTFYFSFGAWLSGMTVPPTNHSIDARIAQYRVAADESACLPIARAIVEGKIRNQRTMVRRALKDEAKRELGYLAFLVNQTKRVSNAGELLGVEGTAARTYFGCFARMLRDHGGFDFSGRNRRPPRDPVNATLSFLYALLVRDCVAALLSVGLEPGLGLFHRVRLGRPSLALDLAEEFRPLIADSIALSALNTGELASTHFVQRGLGVALTDTGRRTAIGAYERRMGQEVVHELFGYALSYRRVLAIQARLLARCLEGDIPAYPAFTTR